MLAVQLVGHGKWHATVSGGAKTSCGTRVPMTASLRDFDLIDNDDRCLDPKCRAARAAAGRIASV